MKGFSVLRVIVAVIVLSSISVHAHAQCANPVGVAGDMTYNDNEYVMQWCDGTNWYGTSQSPYIPNAVTFDGTNDYLQVTALGEGNPIEVTGSFWFRRDLTNLGTTETLLRYMNASGEYFRIRFNTSNELVIDGQENGVGVYNTLLRSSNLITDSEWHNVVFSINSANRALDQLYIDGVDQTNSTGNIFAAGFGGGDVLTIGAYNVGGEEFSGDLSELWIDFDNYIDFSIAANRLQFIDANGWPVNLGTDGSKATGAAPDVFLSGDTATWHTNNGTGGGFTENGALTDALTDPGENLGPTGGLVGWWKLDETSGTTAVDSSGNSNNGSLIDSMTFLPNLRGPIGGSVYFPGYITTNPNRTHGQLSLPSGLLDFNDNSTVSGWINFKDVRSYGRILTGSEGNSRVLLYYPLSGFRYSSGVIGGIVAQSSPVKPYGEWYHFALTYDAGTREHRLYVDGALEDTGSGAGMENYSSFVHLLSWSFNGFEGDMDDLRLYNRVLSAAEITELYDTGFPCKNPVGQRDGDTMYNLTHHVPQFCDLREWVSMTPAPGDGGAGCSNPTGEAGDMMYNASENFMQYCEGDTWQAMGEN